MCSSDLAIASHPAVTECAVIGVHDPTKGQIPRALVVLAPDADAEAVRAELIDLVRREVGPVAALKRVDAVTALPKTRSGKILRKTMRQISDGESDIAVPSTIEDRAVLDALEETLTRQE